MASLVGCFGCCKKKKNKKMPQTKSEIIERLRHSIRRLQEEIHRAETMDELVLLQTVSHSLQNQLKARTLAFVQKQTALWTPIADAQTQRPPPLATRLLQTKGVPPAEGAEGRS
jgi:hypothetical protein